MTTQRIVQRADVEQVVARAGFLQLPGPADRARRRLEEQPGQPLFLVAHRLAVHFRDIAEDLPL